MPKISLFRHPTTVTFLDDDASYLDNLLLSYQSRFPCKAFASPIEALDFLNEDFSIEAAVKRCIKNPLDQTTDQIASHLDLKEIVREVYSIDRFKETAVLAVDYSMPLMNGLDFCKKIKNKNIACILLTGEADNDLAIQAFEQGLIQKFLKKTAPDLREKLPKVIADLEKESFLRLSQSMLGPSNPEHLEYLNDNQTAELFEKICKENHIVEHYILNDMGDFLMINGKGDISYLSIKSEKALKDLHDYALVSEASKEILSALKEQKKLPIFHDAEDTDPAPSDWDHYLYPCERIEGSRFFFAYKKRENFSNSLLSEIQSFDDYLFNC